MKLDDFYYSGFLDYYLHLYCYIHNVSADMSSGLLQVFHVELQASYNKGIFNTFTQVWLMESEQVSPMD